MTDFNVFKLKVGEQIGRHVRVTVFAGPDVDHLAMNGELTFLAHEADAFVEAMEDASKVVSELVVHVERVAPKIAEVNLPTPEWDD